VAREGVARAEVDDGEPVERLEQVGFLPEGIGWDSASRLPPIVNRPIVLKRLSLTLCCGTPGGVDRLPLVARRSMAGGVLSAVVWALCFVQARTSDNIVSALGAMP
jgi:hypothetical protein